LEKLLGRNEERVNNTMQQKPMAEGSHALASAGPVLWKSELYVRNEFLDSCLYVLLLVF
jgi:hypothetical protein